MMQLKLPIYPQQTQMLCDCIGVYERKSIVQYIVNGLPVFSHGKGDLQGFRYITSNLIDKGLCKQSEVRKLFHVSEDSIGRSLKKYREKGESAFFSKDNRQGHSYKIVGEVAERIQKKLDKGQSNNSIAKEEKVSEGAVRQAIKKGYLKKKSG